MSTQKIDGVFEYTKELRFGVVRKLPKAERFKCNFKWLWTSREDAEKEAARLSAKYKDKFYVVEIQSIANVEPVEEGPSAAAALPAI